ncbi:ATP-binding cassette domain-containing protein [Halobellus sp. GM3]|uniref:ATP-binding cassette domain-containing protein n=1 Tax=Halobellus sp. GM3 TaxID=3458410 RepID=UPI00403DCD0C
MTVLRTENLTQRFGELTALDGVDLSVESGTVHSVIGPNGAGKSTLFNVITGLYEPTDGNVYFRGDDITGDPPFQIARRGIARSFQDSDVYLGLTVAENVHVALQSKYDHRRSFRAPEDADSEIRERVRAVLREVGLADRTQEMAKNLSHGNRRRLEIAISVVTDPELLLLDEPTAGMGRQESTNTADIIQRLAADREITIVMIEHDIELVMDASDTISVLQNGRLIARGDPKAVKRNEDVQRAYLGTDREGTGAMDRLEGDESEPPIDRSQSDAETLIELADVCASYGAIDVLRDVSLDIAPGQTVSLIGRNGAGKTTTLRTIAGVLSPTAGTVTLRGREVGSVPEFERSRRGISYVPEDRQIFPELTVAENLRMGELGGSEHRFSVAEVYDLFPRLEERSDHLGKQLSGGEQQMLAIARALVGRTDLLLLDEPTEGLAPQIVEEVLRIIEDIKREGVTVLMVEQNVTAAMSVADHHYIIDQGEIVFEGGTAELRTRPDVLNRYVGVGEAIEE